MEAHPDPQSHIQIKFRLISCCYWPAQARVWACPAEQHIARYDYAVLSQLVTRLCQDCGDSEFGSWHMNAQYSVKNMSSKKG